MRYNPCGRIVDFGRYAFTGPCRFFRDDGTEVQMKWMEADPNALTIPFETAITYPLMEPQDGFDPPVGMDRDVTRKFLGTKAPGGTGRGPVCGTAFDFGNGGAYLPDDPPVVYGPDGLPLCCGANVGDVIDGGVELGGDVPETWGAHDSPGGGFELGGYVPELIDTLDAPGGGFELGGDVPEQWAAGDQAGGGFELGGSAPEVWTAEDLPAGGAELGGDVPEALVFEDLPAGGAEIGGPVVESFGFTDAPGGGAELGGDVPETWSGGSVTPGTSCATAGTLTLGHTYSFSIPSGGAQQWLKFGITSGTQYHVRVSSSANLSGWTLQQGTDCSALSSVGTTFGDGCLSFTATVTGICTVNWFADFFNPQTFHLVADTGPC